jgi:predicted nucleic acid-binding protein
MIAADTSTWVAFLQGSAGKDVELLDRALQDKQLLMVPVVLTELLSDPSLPSDVAKTLAEVPRIANESEYWQSAGLLRARVLSRRRKARLGDALIAQSCLDREVALLTRDRDFRVFAEATGLGLVVLP